MVERFKRSRILPPVVVAEERRIRSEEPQLRALGSAPPQRGTTPAAAIPTLQRLIGNAAVATILGRARAKRRRSATTASRPRIQRYISAEHKEVGEAATKTTLTLDLWAGPPEPFTKTKKVTISYGTANALLGDYYKGWAQLKKAPAPEVERLAGLFSREQTARAAGKSGPTEAEYEQATAGRKTGPVQAGGATQTYLELAEENVDHFTAANREHFLTQHKAALAKGVEAFSLHASGKTAEASAAATEAFGLNAEADHFLQDAFAAGHLVSKPLIQIATLDFWSGGVARAAGDHLRAAAASDQARIWTQIEAHVLPNLTGVQRFALRQMNRVAAINRVLSQILDRLEAQPDKLANLGAKLVHDHLNFSGVQVFSEDDPSTGWRTFGDSFMSRGATMAKALAAQKASVTNVESAITSGLGQAGAKPVSIDGFLKTNNPWRLAPRWAEVPAGTRREVGTALTDTSWIHDLLRTQIFRDDLKGPLYVLLLDNLQLVGTLLQAEAQAAARRRTQQAPEVDKLLKKHSRSFAAGGAPDDVDVGRLARALRGSSADLFASVLDRIEPHDLDDNLAHEFADLHPTRAALVALDQAILLRMNQAMEGGVPTWGERAAMGRIKTALIVKSGQRYVAQLPTKERGTAQKILKNLGTRDDRRARQSEQAGDLLVATHKDVFKPKELAAAAKGQDPAVVLGVIDVILFPDENAKWLPEFAALHTDAEVAALDVAVLDAATKLLSRGAQRRRFDKARAAAHARGAISTVSSDFTKGAQLVDRFRFTSYAKLPQRLVGKSPEVVDAVLGSLDDRSAATVAAEYTKQQSDDDLSALDAALLHRLSTVLQDPPERARVQKALARNLAEAGKRSGV